MVVKTKIDENVQKELSKNMLIFSYICFVLGAIALIAIVSYETIKNVEISIEYDILVSAIFALGLILIISVKITIKNAKVLNRENVYTFKDEYFEIQTMYHNEVEATQKIYYADIYKIKETKNYIFIYQNFNRAFPISKSATENLDELRKLINKKSKKA